MKCIYCNTDREKSYLGGGLYMFKCHKCGSRMEVNNVDGSWTEE